MRSYIMSVSARMPRPARGGAGASRQGLDDVLHGQTPSRPRGTVSEMGRSLPTLREATVENTLHGDVIQTGRQALARRRRRIAFGASTKRAFASRAGGTTGADGLPARQVALRFARRRFVTIQWSYRPVDPPLQCCVRRSGRATRRMKVAPPPPARDARYYV